MNLTDLANFNINQVNDDLIILTRKNENFPLLQKHRKYPLAFRVKAVRLAYVEGNSVASVAKEMHVSAQSIYSWRWGDQRIIKELNLKRV